MDGKIATEMESINGEVGGSSVMMSVDLFDNGDIKAGLPQGFFTNITISAQCYGFHETKLLLCSSSLDTIIDACNKLKNKIEKAKLDYISSIRNT